MEDQLGCCLVRLRLCVYVASLTCASRPIHLPLPPLATQVVRHQIRRNGIHVIGGTARFIESEPGGKIKLAVLLTETDEVRKGIQKHRYVLFRESPSYAAPLSEVARGSRPLAVLGALGDGRLVPIDRDASLPKTMLTADKVMVACGTRPVRSEKIPFDGKRVFDSDQLLWGGIDRLPS